jgi:antitoxin component of RelBE/YafQ-DinJ toxin-antitoxin module
MTKHAKTPRQFIGFRIDEELIAGMKAVAKRDGVPVSEQVRRAIRMWLEQKGVMKERTRPASRKRR